MTVLDASALLALLANEEGADEVVAALAEGAAISAVNLSEVVAKLTDWEVPEDGIREAIGGLGLAVIAFDQRHAYAAGNLRGPTRKAGLSLGDRACLAVGLTDGLPVLTADRTWKQQVPGVELKFVRA